MKIGIQTWGSDGDIRPFCALAGGLAKAGHKVTLAVTSVDRKDYSPLASAMGFEIRHIEGELSLGEEDLKELLLSVERTGDIAKQLRILCKETLEPAIDNMYEAALELSRENNALVAHLVCHTLMTAAEITGRPHVVVSPAPTHLPTGHFPPVGTPALGVLGNRFLWKVSELVINYIFRKSVNGLRKKVNAAPVKSVLRELWISDRLNIIAASPTIIRQAPDWGESVQVTGFFDVPSQAEEWIMPDDMKEFLDAGDPPIYLTFGSFNILNVDSNVRLLTEAARLAGRRAIVQTYWDRASYRPEGPSFFLVDKTPHHKVFPHCAALVHHGGAGTTHSSVYCGLPSVVVAHGFDQPFWADELRRNGVGGKTLHKRKVTPQKIADQIVAVTSDPAMKARAEEMSRSLQAENGVARAVELIEKEFSQVARPM